MFGAATVRRVDLTLRLPPNLASRVHAVRTSLLVVPLAYLVSAGLLTFGVAAAESLIGEESGFADIATAELARDLLPAIGAATLTLAGFVLTITTLSLQFAASTYAPRLVEELRRDAVLQHTLGLALATFAFSFLVLLVVDADHPAVSTAAVGAALLGAATTLLLFIALLARLTASLRPGATMRSITARGLSLVPGVYTETSSGVAESPEGSALPDAAIVDWTALPPGRVVWREGSFGQIINGRFRELVDVAQRHDAVIELTLPVGSFLQQREAVAVVRGVDGRTPAELPSEVERAIHACLSVDCERTVDADPAYPLRLLVDIALRALSPGVNDPTTAVQAIDHLEQILVALAPRQLGRQTVQDDLGVTRLIVPAPGWDALVMLAFIEIGAAADDPQSKGALERTLSRLRARVPEHRRAAVDHARAALDPGKGPTPARGEG